MLHYGHRRWFTGGPLWTAAVGWATRTKELTHLQETADVLLRRASDTRVTDVISVAVATHAEIWRGI